MEIPAGPGLPREIVASNTHVYFTLAREGMGSELWTYGPME
jgi:hypothetical protein